MIKYLLYTSLPAFLAGLIFFAYKKELLIIRLPSISQNALDTAHRPAIQKKKIILYFWRDHTWHHEAQEILWTQHTSENLERLVSSLLALFDEEQITSDKITLQSIALSPCGSHAYLSIDRPLLPAHQSIMHKWMIIESILKTVRQNDLAVHDITFLVRHEIMHDTHLEFLNPWPIQGFSH